MKRQGTAQSIKDIVKGEYRQAALQAKNGGSSCCATRKAGKFDPMTSNLSAGVETDALPTEAVLLAAELRAGCVWQRPA